MICKYTISLIHPASGKILKIPFNATTSLTMKPITAERFVYKFSMNLCKHCPNKSNILYLLSK